MKKVHNHVPQTVVQFILDQTGSMGAIATQTISGFNEYLQTLKRQEGNISFSLTLFNSDRIEKRYVDLPISEVSLLSAKNYVPAGMTPLYDAVVDSVEAVNEKVMGRQPVPSVIVVIMTDGEENASRNHDEKCMRELIERLTARGNWTFAYLGANQDAWANARNFGIPQGNTMAFVADAAGITRSFNDLKVSNVNYAKAVMSSGGGGGAGYSTNNLFNDKTEKVK